MAVQYATGFGGLDLVTQYRPTSANNWPFFGYDGIPLKIFVGSSNSGVSYGEAGIITDPTFPSRKLATFKYQNNNGGPEFIGLMFSGAEEARDGVVFGFTFSESYSGPTPSNNASAPFRRGISIMSSTAEKTKSSSMGIADPKQCLVVLGDTKASGTPARFPLCTYGRNTFTAPSSAPDITYGIDTTHHVEVKVERSTKRVRVYVDDGLVQDFVFDGADIGTIMKGIQLVIWRDGSYSTSYVFNIRIGNIYLLSLDDAHTDRLGASARVVDYIPSSDRQAEMMNSNSDAKGNYQTAAQMFDDASEYSLMAASSGSTDLYSLPQSIYSDAAEIHGIGVKVRAVDVSGLNHNLSSATRSKSANGLGPVVQLSNSMGTVFSDASINPDTNKKWSVAEVAAGSIGVKGGFK